MKGFVEGQRRGRRRQLDLPEEEWEGGGGGLAGLQQPVGARPCVGSSRRPRGGQLGCLGSRRASEKGARGHPPVNTASFAACSSTRKLASGSGAS